MFKSLVNWYQEKGRELPWRKTKDPYKIWLSEVILQQTRVDQGLSYYNKFVARFPKVEDLAAADIDKVLLMWQGLGYYTRARNLHSAAQTIVNDFNGFFPDTLIEIKKLKGVGDYTAAAVASIAFNIPIAVVDGNVFRVLSRYFEVSTPVDTGMGKKEFDKLAGLVLNKESPGQHNQAMMELGATVCTPKAPVCYSCPLIKGCGAYSTGRVLNFPVKKGKIKQKTRYFYFLIVLTGEQVLIEKRTGKDIWEGLYQFPLIETNKKLKGFDLVKQVNNHFLVENTQYTIGNLSAETKHILSHQVIYAKFITVIINNVLPKNNGLFLKVDFTSLGKFAFPRVITRHLEEKGDQLLSDFIN